MNSKRKKTP